MNCIAVFNFAIFFVAATANEPQLNNEPSIFMKPFPLLRLEAMARGIRDTKSQVVGIVNTDIPVAPANTLKELSDESNNVPAVATVASTSGEEAKKPLEPIYSPIFPDTVNEVASSCGLEYENDDEVNDSPLGTSNPKKTECKKEIKKTQKKASSRVNNDLEDDRLMELLLDGFMDDEDFDFDYDEPAALMSSIKRNRRTANNRHASQRTRRYQRRYKSHDL